MPEPLIALQKRLTPTGEIRAGGEKPESGVGRKLECYRLTSQRRELIEQAAQLYGGEVMPWESPAGPAWQVYTQAHELPVLVMPGYSLRQSYERWEGATKRVRICDGVEEALTGGPCLCNQQGEDVCDIYTRLVVALPELDTAHGWRLITKSANAAHELPGMMALIDTYARGAPFVAARLRIDQRRGVKDGQVVRYVVPVLDLGVNLMQVAQGVQGVPPQIPAAAALGVPEADAIETAARRSPTTEQALQAVTGPPRLQRSNVPPLPDVELGGVAGPEVDETDKIPFGDAPAGGYSEARQTMYATDAQKKKLNVLVGQLREAGHITTDGLYNGIGRLRERAGVNIAEEIGGYDETGVLHWAPLRETLTRPEANQLIDWLEEKQRRVHSTRVTA